MGVMVGGRCSQCILGDGIISGDGQGWVDSVEEFSRSGEACLAEQFSAAALGSATFARRRRFATQFSRADGLVGEGGGRARLRQLPAHDAPNSLRLCCLMFLASGSSLRRRTLAFDC